MSGVVLADGTFEAVDVETQAGMEPFAASVRDVLTWWRFVPAVDHVACVPKRSEAAFAVWFEGSEASPRVFFSFPQVTNRSSQPPKVESFDAPTVRFPKKLLTIEGQVRVLRLVDPAGEVISAAIRSSTPAGAFDEIVLAAARKTKVTWSEPRPTERMCVEQAYQFCMSREADARISFDRCRTSQ